MKKEKRAEKNSEIGEVKEEITDRRPGNYSYWHRDALPSFCYAWDIDWVEARGHDGDLEPVALIETIEIEEPEKGPDNYSVWGSKHEIYFKIIKKLEIPFYVVWHNSVCGKFCVMKYMWENDTKKKWKKQRIMNEKEYSEFLKNLEDWS